jgi:c-di-GMP-binding flagellar brake protein YcgR
MEQRRNFYRMPVVMPVSVTHVGSGESHQTTTLDLSVGGVRLLGSRDLGAGDTVRMTISLTDYGELEATGRVVRRDLAGEWCAIAFDPMPMSAEKLLSKFLADQQRAWLAKGAR